jgi:hypothetical protein
MFRRLEDMADLLRIPEDGLMLGKLQYRCLSCNGPTSKLHDALAEKMVKIIILIKSPRPTLPYGPREGWGR